MLQVANRSVPGWRLWLSCAQHGEPAAFQGMAKISTSSCCNAAKPSLIKKSLIPYFSVLWEDGTVIFTLNVLIRLSFQDIMILSSHVKHTRGGV